MQTSQVRYGYENKEYDSLVGDTDFHFRKMNPDWGIFTQPDTLIQNVYDPQSLNRYMFERGNPYSYVDEDGHAVMQVISVAAFIMSTGVMIYKIATGKVTVNDWSMYIAGAGATIATAGFFRVRWLLYPTLQLQQVSCLMPISCWRTKKTQSTKGIITNLEFIKDTLLLMLTISQRN